MRYWGLMVTGTDPGLQKEGDGVGSYVVKYTKTHTLNPAAPLNPASEIPPYTHTLSIFMKKIPWRSLLLEEVHHSLVSLA